MAQRSETGRTLTADDWIDAARKVIAESGVAALGVEPLARRLSVTKGSFYWHFRDRDALLHAVLERWEHEGTAAQIAATEHVENPRDRLSWLIDEAFADRPSTDRRFLLALADAGRHPLVEPVLRRVTERRLDHLESCYHALGHDARGARLWALHAYAVYLGSLRLQRDAPERAPQGREIGDYRRHLAAALVAPPGRRGWASE